jgi:alkylation response protein AidB-like acyl-CoA dehydrogenase
MAYYQAPLTDITNALNTVGLKNIATLPGFEDASEDLVNAVLEEAAKFAQDVLAPLNTPGDKEGCTFKDKNVSTPKGFKNAYELFVESGWNGLPSDVNYGGQGLPSALATAVAEMWQGANMSFALCPMLTQGAVDALTHHGSEALKAVYLEKLISGEWTGTMNLTEPQAGSDLSAIRTKAEPDGAHYRITGQKIFITHGEHDMAENIIHLVLARLPDAPAGVKGISMFIVPKFLVDADGILGERNDAYCTSIEHKMGIHASPTAVMSFGDSGGAIGYLVGEENHGLEYMFTMMNNARLAVGIQGVAQGERAYQKAKIYATERTQGKDISGQTAGNAPILRHPDVRRMLLSMRATTEASRLIAYQTAAYLDFASHGTSDAEKTQAANLAALLTPIAKAWSTDMGIRAADMGIQVHGGMGFVEETGAAQIYRDARIAAIYEGTNGIQAGDLIGRKLARENGATMLALIATMKEELAAMPDISGAAEVAATIPHLEAATSVILERKDALHMGTISVPYLHLAGLVIGGWLLVKSLQTAQASENTAYATAKEHIVAFFTSFHLQEAAALAKTVATDAQVVMAMDDTLF